MYFGRLFAEARMFNLLVLGETEIVGLTGTLECHTELLLIKKKFQIGTVTGPRSSVLVRSRLITV